MPYHNPHPTIIGDGTRARLNDQKTPVCIVENIQTSPSSSSKASGRVDAEGTVLMGEEGTSRVQ